MWKFRRSLEKWPFLDCVLHHSSSGAACIASSPAVCLVLNMNGFPGFRQCSDVPTSSLTWIYRRVLMSQPLRAEAFRRNRFYLKSVAIFIILPVCQTEWKLLTSKIENLVFSHNYTSLFTKWMSHPCFWPPLGFRPCFEYPIWQLGWRSLVFSVLVKV